MLFCAPASCRYVAKWGMCLGGIRVLACRCYRCSEELAFEADRLDACYAVKMLDDRRHMRKMACRLAMLHAATMAACAPPRPASLSRCADDVRIYDLADTLRGVRPA